MKLLCNVLTSVIALSLFSTGVHAKADSLLFENAVNGTTANISIGLGQPITVTTTTTLDGVAFDLATTKANASVKYLIFDASGATLLYSAAPIAVTSATSSWLEGSVNYTLMAGSSYVIAAISNLSVTAMESSGADVHTGIAVGGTDDAYMNYANPYYFASGSNEIAVQLFGTQDTGVSVSAAPEPSSLVLLGTGLVSAIGVARRRLRA